MSHEPQSYLRGHLVVVIDCGDLDRAAQFWTSVLGYARSGNPSGPYQGLAPSDGQGVEILLQRVPEAKSGKNRLHLDLRTADLKSEVERVVALGAQRLTSEPVTEDGWSWHILADADGNSGVHCSEPTRIQNGCPAGSASTYNGSSLSSVRSYSRVAPSSSARCR